MSGFAEHAQCLRRAQDLIANGRPAQAFEQVEIVLLTKRYRTWSVAMQDLAKLFVELAVQLRKHAKDALAQYRYVCQLNMANISSVGVVLRHYREVAEARTRKAQEEANVLNPTAELSLDDEEASAAPSDDEDDDGEGGDVMDAPSPESLLLQAVSGEDDQSRAAREVLKPWLRYQIDTYRCILEVVRNNVYFEDVYHETALQAFEHCREFKRTAAFRRMGDVLRQHWGQINKYQNQDHAVNLRADETQALYLQTRFRQLEVAAELELWQEAYRLIEDIHAALEMADSDAEPSVMATYYDKMAQIFWASGDGLFHAYSIEMLLSLKMQELDHFRRQVGRARTKQQHSRAQAQVAKLQREVRSLASAVVLAALVAPSADSRSRLTHAYLESYENNSKHLADLLHFRKGLPSRAALKRRIRSLGILQRVQPEVQQLYSMLEDGFSPLTLRESVEKLLASPAFAAEEDAAEFFSVSAPCAKYAAHVRELTAVRVVQQLSRTFTTMRFQAVHELCMPDVDAEEFERLLLRAASSERVGIRIDHRQQMVEFVDYGFDAEHLHSQLSEFSKRLNDVLPRINPSDPVRETQTRERIFAEVWDGMAAEQHIVSERQQVIEKRKQTLERLSQKREEEEAARRAAEAAEAARRDAEARAAILAKREAEQAAREALEAKVKANEQLIVNVENHVRNVLGLAVAAAPEPGTAPAAGTATPAAGASTTSTAGPIGGAPADAVTASDLESSGFPPEIAARFADLRSRLEEISQQDIVNLQNELVEEHERKQEEEHGERAKLNDFCARVVREEEQDMRREQIEEEEYRLQKETSEQMQQYEQQQREIHARALAEKKRLMRMRAQRDAFVQKVMERRQAAYEQAVEEQRERLAPLREQKRQEAAQQRAKQEAVERRAREEAERRQKEEERLRKLDEAAAARRKREAELEARDSGRSSFAPSAGAYRPRRTGAPRAPPSSTGAAASSGAYRPPRTAGAAPPSEGARPFRRGGASGGRPGVRPGAARPGSRMPPSRGAPSAGSAAPSGAAPRGQRPRFTNSKRQSRD